MVNIGFLGGVSVGKTTLLRNFVSYINRSKVPCSLIKIDFSGESVQIDADKETKTIHPNRVFFKDDITGSNHTLFAPGGDRERAVVRMGIITISRIAKQIVTVFSLDRPLKEQFEFFESIRHIPKEIYVCFNKFDFIKYEDNDKLSNSMIEELKMEELKIKVNNFFNKRKVKIKNIFFTCAEMNEEFNLYNNNAAQMILKIATENVETFSNSKSYSFKMTALS
ncbi:MAG: hypothetical protein GY870_11990 [archaeon]|nr:hypothetical protein [archaeon]